MVLLFLSFPFPSFPPSHSRVGKRDRERKKTTTTSFFSAVSCFLQFFVFVPRFARRGQMDISVHTVKVNTDSCLFPTPLSQLLAFSSPSPSHNQVRHSRNDMGIDGGNKEERPVIGSAVGETL
jgi:hypothetical protein